MRLAICDDADVLRAVLARLCGSLGHDIVGACANLAAGIAAAESERPDAIVLDGRLAAPIGPAVSALLRASPESAVYVTASLEERELVLAARAAGAAGAIRRPFARSDLLAAFGAAPSEDASNG